MLISVTARPCDRRWKTWTSSSTRRPTAATCPRWPSTSTSTASAPPRCSRPSATRTCRSKRSSSPPPRPSTAKARRSAREHGLVFPETRPTVQLAAGDCAVRLSDLWRTFDADDHAGGGPDRRRDGLRHHQVRSGAAGPELGAADRRPDRGAALLLHLRAAPVDLQPLHGGDRDLRDAPAERPAARALRGRRADPRLLLRRATSPAPTCSPHRATRSTACRSTSAAGRRRPSARSRGWCPMPWAYR